MKCFSKDVSMNCPLCGNDQFESIEDSKKGDDTEQTKLRCSDCGSVYAEDELIEANSSKIEANIEELDDDIMGEVDKELEEMFRKWK